MACNLSPSEACQHVLDTFHNNPPTYNTHIAIECIVKAREHLSHVCLRDINTFEIDAKAFRVMSNVINFMSNPALVPVNIHNTCFECARNMLKRGEQTYYKSINTDSSLEEDNKTAFLLFKRKHAAYLFHLDTHVYKS